jgi:hypothetical protein
LSETNLRHSKRSSPQSKRCSWVNADDPLLLQYHDREWGVPAHSDRKLFEVLILSGVQAGLNWSLVLNKREGYRRAFNLSLPPLTRILPGGLESYLASGLSRSMVFASGEGAMERTHV